MISVLIAVTVLEMSRNGIDLKVDADRTQIDPGRSVFLTVTMKTPKDVKASVPDLRDRVRGFSLAEDFAGKPVKNADGSLVETVNWKLIPEPCADVYKIAPFAVTASPRLLSTAADEGSLSFVAGPIYFENPPARETVTATWRPTRRRTCRRFRGSSSAGVRSRFSLSSPWLRLRGSCCAISRGASRNTG